MRAPATALAVLAMATHPAAPAVKRSSTSPPLYTGTDAGMSAAEEASASSPSSGGEPLAGNGLRSPLCRAGRAADLPASAARDCRLVGFEAAQAPSGDYAFDVHIDTGVTRLSNDAAATVQNLMQFAWTSQVAIVHGLIVLLDWCFTLDLLNSPAMSGVAGALRATQATFTQPWLAAMLAIASVTAAYRGLIRRRVAETLGETLLMLAMMAGGLWVITDPAGTVGTLGAWANQASLGALGAVVAGSPAHPQRALAESNQHVFAAAIDGPWCYLEFADVGWCEGTTSLDPRLRAAALRIAARGGADAPGPSAALVRAARTNGELFLALPANGPARNSINDVWSLYRVLCGSSGEPCSGPTAALAQARTQSGTGARVIGMAFITVGLLGMVLVLGFLALQLLHAAIVSLICLLLTPAAVLAPALGERGRGAFRAWGTRLIGAMASKVVFAFLLGAVLESERALASVPIGWLTQWVLVSAMWWLGFLNRHRLIDFAHGGQAHRHPSIAVRARQALDTPRAALRHAGQVKHRLTRPPPAIERRHGRQRVRRERDREPVDTQVASSLNRRLGEARAQVAGGSQTQAQLTAMRTRLERVRQARQQARAVGDARRAVRLGGRERRLAEEIAHGREALRGARRTVTDSEGAQRRTGVPHTRVQREEHARFLDAQAALPRAGRVDAHGRRRDYAALAGLAGYGPQAYERLDPRGRREARMLIDRELAMRGQLAGATAGVASAGNAPERSQRHGASPELERRLGALAPAAGRRPPSRIGSGLGSEPGSPGTERPDSSRHDGADAAGSHPRRRGSPVMDDAREVAARRKRQLGWGRR